MAPNISNYKRNLIIELLTAGYPYRRIARAIRVDNSTVRRIKRNISITGHDRLTAAPGPARRLTREEIMALLQHLVEKPELYLDEMCWFIWDEFGKLVSRQTLSRYLREAGWSRKAVS